MRFAYWRYLTAAVVAFLALGSAPAWAQTYTVSVVETPDLGVIVPAALTDTTFSFASSSGNVGQSGTAVRRSVGLARAQISISCTGGKGNDCGNDIAVKIGAIGTPTGKAGALTSFNATAISGSITSVSGSNPLTFNIKPSNKNTPAAFYVGASLPITASNSAGAFGAATSQFYVYAGISNPTTGATVTVNANTYRGVSVSGSTLNFGGVVRPNTGSATVTLDPATNQRTISGSTGISANVSRAAFTITGENSLAITVSQDNTLTLNRSGGGTIAVDLTRTTLPIVIGSGGSVGAQGTSTFYTGGSFTVGSGTLIGVYTGSYNTTVSYN